MQCKKRSKPPMKLELDITHINDVRFGDRTSIQNGVLSINLPELRKLLLEDHRLSNVDIELAHPGESCRIVQTSDVIEPRVKKSGSDDFPGVVGRHTLAGSGRTGILRGTAVVLSDCSGVGEFVDSDPNGEIIDMSGPAAELGIYGRTQNVVVLPYPADGVSPHQYRIALKIAGLKTAVYLASAAKELTPDATEIYELPPLTDMSDISGLPRVAYIFQLLTAQFEPLPGEPVLYGLNVDRMVPTILHPNEVMDGALTRPYRTYGVDTYIIQNHPIIKELYQKHGKELCFAGVIAAIAYSNTADYERAATMCANLAKYVIGAEGVILTKTGGGAPEVSMARTAQKCEALGVKTALALLHMAADPLDAKHEASTIFSSPEINAVVSMGTPFIHMALPAVERVIGKTVSVPGEPPIDGDIEKWLYRIRGTTSQLGSSRLTAVRY